MKGNRERHITQAWYIAALSRHKKLKGLDVLLGKQKNMLGLRDALKGFGRVK